MTVERRNADAVSSDGIGFFFDKVELVEGTGEAEYGRDSSIRASSRTVAQLRMSFGK